ncbi:ABC transporter permease [Yinghuangia soli]|uniref:ABC transporter permease n=1 Tax=Yinghuangia soli TaxID=2908204 RepID=A0AA41Q4I3_9ACTN|nr:ABC transporter permease [Yinghuangia soli]MCF2531415.1 ABC transporter permease [Yinghuangia soli]
MATPTPQPQQPNQPPNQPPQPVPAGVHQGAAANGHAYAAPPNAAPGANGQPGGAPQWQPNGQAPHGAGAVPAQGLYQQAPTGSLHFTRMLQSEWTKIRTVRSTMWSLLVMVVLIVGLAALLGATVSDNDGSGNPDPSVSLALIGVMIAQIAAATLGVLTISAEYTTGMIRSTLTAYPRRITVLAAKSVVFGTLMFVVGLVACYLAYLVCDAVVASDVAGSSSGKEVVKGVVGSATYLALIGLFALGVGTMLRHSAGAITTVLGIMLVPSIFGGFIPGKFGDWVVDYSPMMLLIKMIAPADDADLGGGLGPWPGMILMACYAAAALVGAATLIKSRDV